MLSDAGNASPVSVSTTTPAGSELVAARAARANAGASATSECTAEESAPLGAMMVPEAALKTHPPAAAVLGTAQRAPESLSAKASSASPVSCVVAEEVLSGLVIIMVELEDARLRSSEVRRLRNTIKCHV